MCVCVRARAGVYIKYNQMIENMVDTSSIDVMLNISPAAKVK